MDNLVDNAISHNKEGGWLREETAADRGYALVTVANGGPALDEAEVRQLGRPVRRLGRERTAGNGRRQRIVPDLEAALPRIDDYELLVASIVAAEAK